MNKNRTDAERDAYEDGQDDHANGCVDDLRAMRCEYYAAGVRAAHYGSCELSY